MFSAAAYCPALGVEKQYINVTLILAPLLYIFFGVYTYCLNNLYVGLYVGNECSLQVINHYRRLGAVKLYPVEFVVIDAGDDVLRHVVNEDADLLREE